MITVGKHTAPEGSGVHPIVAGALARRGADGAEGQPAPDERTAPVGWPAPPSPGDGGLGWPGRDLAHPAPEEEVPAVEEPPEAGQRGWRRLFRSRPAA